MYCKVMPASNMENIARRIKSARDLLYMLCVASQINELTDSELDGIADLLDCICRDFTADIDAAGDFIPEGKIVV